MSIEVMYSGIQVVMDPLKSSEWWCDGRMIHLMNESEVICMK